MKTIVKAGAFILGLIAGGAATWFQPYNEILVWGMDYRLLMAIATFILAFLYRFFSSAGTTTTGLYLGTGVIAALVLRIIIDVVGDYTSHNLWPMELALFALVAFPSAFIGAYLAELMAWSKAK